MRQLTRLQMLSAISLLLILRLPALAQDKPDRLAASDIFNLQFASDPQISPDGRRLAYTSDKSGREEIYVQPFPALGNKWRVSVGGGEEPR